MNGVYIFYIAVLVVVFSGFAGSLWLALVHDRRLPREQKDCKRSPGR